LFTALPPEGVVTAFQEIRRPPSSGCAPRAPGAGGMMSDQTAVGNSAAFEVPIAFFATIFSRTPFDGPLPGVATSHTATGHDVVDTRSPAPEYISTSYPVIGELLANPGLQRTVRVRSPNAVTFTAVTGSGLSCTDTVTDPQT
jgi:hypothetical protein